MSENKVLEYKVILENAKKEVIKIMQDSKSELDNEIKNKKSAIEKEIENEISKAQKEIIEFKKNSITSIQNISEEITLNIIENISTNHKLKAKY